MDSKPYPLPLKHDKFVKKEIANLLETRPIERSMSPYTAPIIVVSRESKPGTPLIKTKRLVIDYWELNKQILRLQTTQVKSKGSLALKETVKMDHIWSKCKVVQYFTILNIRSGYYHILTHPDSRQKTALICPYGKIQWK